MDPHDIEHERKFLVSDLSVVSGTAEGTSIVQGYLPAADGFSVRIRWLPTLDTYQLTVKGKRHGISRVEQEEEVSRKLGEALLHACGTAVIEKTRFPVLGPDGHGWDVDVFFGRNEGLVMAELELDRPETTFELPDWCGSEVTTDERYYNDYLARVPFASWNLEEH